jgi:hypothetical protein
MPLVERFDYRQQEARFRAACEWLRAKGIAVAWVAGGAIVSYTGLLFAALEVLSACASVRWPFISEKG